MSTFQLEYPKNVGEVVSSLQSGAFMLNVYEDTDGHQFVSTWKPEPGMHGLMFVRADDGKSRSAASEGLVEVRSNVAVNGALIKELNDELAKPDSDIRRLSCVEASYAFVYLDVADFSKASPGHQVLKINSVRQLVNNKIYWSTFCAEPPPNVISAKLCIGDGYIYVLKNASVAAYFAAHLAGLITLTSARKLLPVELHFRIGVHFGPVYHFWDEGRKDWNYVGDGINGGNRVISVIDKSHDDIVFISDKVRDSMLADKEVSGWLTAILSNLTNRGRREDKHQRAWRVYELNHMAVFRPPSNLPNLGAA